MKILAIGMAATSLLAAVSAHAEGVTYGQVSKALSDSPGCTDFAWSSGGPGLEHGAILLPVQINGKKLTMQLDTGAQASQTYGAIAERSGWLKAGQAAFSSESFQIANVKLTKRRIQDNKEMSAEGVSGTVGLDELLGHVIAIDYRAKKFCMFSAAEAPTEFDNMDGTHGSIRNGKLFLPVNSAGFSSESVMFDTGSSGMGLVVDLDHWKALTGSSDPTKAPFKIDASSWGKTIAIQGAYMQAPLSIGKVALGKEKVFTLLAAPNTFSHWPFKVDGILGNAPFESGMVVLDLTAQVWFGYIRP